jgi:pimeloyl-ACP methyl ester carboxylesterase
VEPFRQRPFAELPERPRVPHRWADCVTHREVLDGPFGRIPVVWRTFGEGPPVVLVHGLMTAGYSFRYLLEPLGGQATLVIPDLPGSGDSAMPDGPYGPDRLADWVGAFVGQVGARGAPAIGNSLGGYLCLRLALRDPGALGALLDLHSPGMPLLRLRALHAALSTPGAFRLLAWLVGRDPKRWVHRNVHYYDESLKSREETRIWAAPLSTPDGVRAFGEILRDTLDPSEIAAFVATLEGRRDRGEGFPVPLWLVYADTDPVVPPWIGDALHARIPGSRLVKLSRASHFAHVDAVDAFVGVAREFLADYQGSPPG